MSIRLVVATKIAVTVIGVVFGLATCGVAQTRWSTCPPVCSPVTTPWNAPRYHVTYEGRVFVSFPNYDIALSGTPSSPSQFPRPSSAGEPRVIFKDNRGMYWDGGSYFLHPAYRQDLVTRNYYSQRFVDAPHAQWPPVPEVVIVQPPYVEEVPTVIPPVYAPDRSPVPLPNLPPMPLPVEPKKKVSKEKTFPTVPNSLNRRLESSKARANVRSSR